MWLPGGLKGVLCLLEAFLLRAPREVLRDDGQVAPNAIVVHELEAMGPILTLVGGAGWWKN